MRRKNVKGGTSDPVEAALEAELVRRDRDSLPDDFFEFVKASFPIVEPYVFKDGLHIRAICEHMQAVAERRIKRLCINVPPRYAKSTICTVLFPAWVLARNPTETFLYASYSQKLATRDSTKTRTLIESDWYQARFPHVQIRDDENLKTAFKLTSGGGRSSTSVGGTVTGMGGSIRVIDDPLNAKDGDSDTVRETANQWFRESWGNRIDGDPAQACSVVIMQRLHSRDTSAICEEAGWDMLVLPEEYEAESKPTSIGWTDPRTEFGQLLWPEQWNREFVEANKKQIGSYGYSSQYQQRPTPRGGGMIKKRWLKFWFDPELCPDPEPVMAQLEDGEYIALEQVAWTPLPRAQYTASWDMAMKGNMDSDFVVGQVWAKTDLGFMLVDQERGRWDFPATCDAVRRLDERWRAVPTLIEGKANGSAVISALKKEIDGLIEVNPEGGKIARVAAVAPLYEAGNVWLPHPAMMAWVDSHIHELTLFPRGANDDQADAASQALVRMREGSVTVVDMGAVGGESRGSVQGPLVQDYYWDAGYDYH